MILLPQIWSEVESSLPLSEARQCRLPSFQDTFSGVIAAANSLQQDGGLHRAHSASTTPAPRDTRASPGLECSWRGSISSVPGLSPISTANSSPTISPLTPPAHYSISSQSQLRFQVMLPPWQEDPARQRQQRLAFVRSRRTTRSPPIGFDTASPAANNQHHHKHHHHHYLNNNNNTTTTSSSRQQQRSRTTAATTAGTNSIGAGISADNNTNANLNGNAARRRHFNQKYKNPDKLFIVYHKDDLKWGWPAIQAQRLQLLPVLLNNDYDRAVEEAREVAGLNGMYYRENDLNMPVLTPDGSALVLVERNGRWWECTRSQKCRSGEHKVSNGSRRAAAVTGGSGGCGDAATAADTRPRGMVERYPEEVLLYWDNHVRHFIPEDKREEVYARAKRYCEIRAEQRRQHNIPPWSLDNKEDRVLDLNEPKRGSDESQTATSPQPSSTTTTTICRGGRVPRRLRRS